MKRWSLLSIPLVGLASITVWAQAVTGAPTTEQPGVIVREPAPRDLVLKGSTENPGVSPRTSPRATPKSSSPALKSAPLDPAPATEAPDATENTDEEAGVELVEPRQVTSPAVEPTDDSTSSSQLDGKDGLSGTSSRSGSSNE
jgi:hypothetical protein